MDIFDEVAGLDGILNFKEAAQALPRDCNFRYYNHYSCLYDYQCNGGKFVAAAYPALSSSSCFPSELNCDLGNLYTDALLTPGDIFGDGQLMKSLQYLCGGSDVSDGAILFSNWSNNGHFEGGDEVGYQIVCDALSFSVPQGVPFNGRKQKRKEK